MENQGWEKTKINTVNRLRNRGKYDFQTVNTIVDETPLLHVSFTPPAAEDGTAQFPVILPMLGCTSTYPDPPLDDKSESRVIYLHGSSAARMVRMASATDSAKEGIQGVDGNSSMAKKGMPVCVAATQLDGIVLALTPFSHSCNYRSATIFGHAHLVTDEAERLHAMHLITNNLIPSRWENSRIPPTNIELTSTGILRVEIESASAKVRTGTTGEDRKDLKNEEMRREVWAGVVPTYLRLGDPVAAKTNLKEGLPEYLGDWVEGWNDREEGYARRVTE